MHCRAATSSKILHTTTRTARTHHGLVGVDRLVQLLAIEELAQHGLDLGNTRRASHEHYLIDLALGNIGILEDLIAWVQTLLEVIHAEIFESGPGDGRIVINSIEKGIDLNMGLSRA